MTRVLIVDDHRVVRMGLEALIEETEDLTVIGTADNGAAACELAAQLEPDVVLMDLNMPIMDGVQATEAILNNNPSIKIVVLTSFSDRDRVEAALNAGAIGYQLKDADTATLLRGIRDAAAGNAPLDPRVATQLLASRETKGHSPQLTAREEEVLQLIGQGLLNKQIARQLDIAESTVKTHLTSIYNRLGVTDRTQAALLAQRRKPSNDQHP